MCTHKHTEQLLRKLLHRAPTELEVNVNWGNWSTNPRTYEMLLARVNETKEPKGNQ